LDILRSFQKEPDSLRVFLDELAQSDRVTRQSLEAITVNQANPFCARRLAQNLAVRWQVQLMERSQTPGASQAYYDSRVENGSPVFGLQAKAGDCKKILERFIAPFE
jgi:hypothetical protein